MGDNDNNTDTPPRGVTDDEWQALGDPGKNALRRERQVRSDLERQLAEARRAPVQQQSPPAPVPPAAPAAAAPTSPPAALSTDTPVFASLIKDAIEAAISPLRQRFEQDDAAKAQQAFTSTLGERAGQVLADVRDAVLLDTTALVDANGAPDNGKIDEALKQLVADRPHLAKQGGQQQTPAQQQAPQQQSPQPTRVGQPITSGQGFSPAPPGTSDDDAVKDLRTKIGLPPIPATAQQQ